MTKASTDTLIKANCILSKTELLFCGLINNKTNHIPGGAAIVGAIGAGTPRPAARPIPAPGAALAPSNLDFD